MDIVNSNFEAKYDEIIEAIDSCWFLSIDGEFTGIQTNNVNFNKLDTIEERYEKIRSGSRDLLLIQFGLCTFKRTDDGKFSQKTFNFSVYPHEDSFKKHFYVDRRCVKFLLRNDFDWNSFIKEGVPFLKEEDEKKVVKKRKIENEILYCNTECVKLTEEHREYLSRFYEDVDNFIAGNELELMVEPCDLFTRSIVLKELKNRYPQLHIECRLTSDKEDVLFILKEKPDEDLIAIETNNFCNIINAISKSGKLVVGHNMILDLCNVISQFVQTLPKSYVEFIALVNRTFPSILDTKHMATNIQCEKKLRDTSLGKLYKRVGYQPFKHAEVKSEGESSYEGQMKEHEAGYDAYITGLVFISLLEYEAKLKNQQLSLDVAKLYYNKLFVNYCYDVPYIHIADTIQLSPLRDDVFHICFPTTWKKSNIRSLFKQFGKITICWIDESSAWVIVNALQKTDKCVIGDKTYNNLAIADILNNEEHVTVNTYRNYKAKTIRKAQLQSS